LNQVSEDEQLARAVLRLNGTVLGLASGMAAGLALFVATNWLVLKGGEQVGPHLSLLNQFFIGYSVTFGGSLIGLAYGFALGFVLGWLVAWVYNGVVLLKRGYLTNR
jgi:hypothetical protein